MEERLDAEMGLSAERLDVSTGADGKFPPEVRMLEAEVLPQGEAGGLVDIISLRPAGGERLDIGKRDEAGVESSSFLRRGLKQGGKEGGIKPVGHRSRQQGLPDAGALRLREVKVDEIHHGEREQGRVAIGGLEDAELGVGVGHGEDQATGPRTGAMTEARPPVALWSCFTKARVRPRLFSWLQANQSSAEGGVRVTERASSSQCCP